MLQYKIPQNVGIADKIVGPFSLRQLIILAIGGGVSYVLFAITSRFYELNMLEYILIVFPALFSLALAMLKIHNVTFGKYLLLILEFAIKPKKRLWDHRGIATVVDPDLSEKSTAHETSANTIPKKRPVNLRDLSLTLDSGGFEHLPTVSHEDIDEVGDDDLITAAYFDHKKGSGKMDNMYWRTREVQKKKLEILAKKPSTQKGQKILVIQKENPVKKEVPPKQAIQTKEVRINSALPKESGGQQAVSGGPEKSGFKTQSSGGGQMTEIQTSGSQTLNNQRMGDSSSVGQNSASSKKKRKRKKKKPQSDPIRPNAPVNTLSPNTVSDSGVSSKQKTSLQQTEAETSFQDLTEGGEIEFNLD